MYLVALCTVKCAPNSSGRTSIGVAKVLSTINAAPAARTISAMRSSGATRSSGFEIVSTSTQPGFDSSIALRNASRSQTSAKRTLTPNGSITFISKPTVAPYSALAASTDLRRSASAASSAMWMAIMPELQASAP